MGEPSSKSRGDLQGLRCQHCVGPLLKEMETSEWTVSPLNMESFSLIGSAGGGTAEAFYGFNHAMPFVRRWTKGPMLLHFLIGAPPVIVFSSGCAGLTCKYIPYTELYGTLYMRL
ncbi:uncharacterized protein [Primulina huaijiensis]|uniref:uncharacterized protein n=1 Tax=Primulina huaijiensis TaxID=1492673 RepID=UPI003CC71D1D